MKKIFLFFVLTILLSCKSGNSLDGVYEYAPNKESNGNIFRMSAETACSMIGRFEFKNGKCYFNVMGIEQRVDYDVDNGVVYLNSNKFNSNAGMGIRIIDGNTLDYMGCIFKKVGENDEPQAIENVENSSTEKKSKNETENSNIRSKENSLNSLRKFNGEYPYDVKLLSNPTLKKRLINLIGKKKYEYMKETWAVEGGINVENDILEAGGCEAHNCNMTNYIIVVDLKKDILYVGYMVEEEIKKFGETNNFPEQLLKWEQENIKSKNDIY